MVYERVIKGLIAATLNEEENIKVLIDEFKPVMDAHYSKWFFGKELKQMYLRVSADILNNEIV